MSKYIPKVGEAFQFINDTSNCWVQCGKVIAETDTELAYLSASNGKIRTIKKERRFFPVSTKADVEREQLLEIIEECYDSGCSIITKAIQEAGFTIPKKIKRSELHESLYFAFLTPDEQERIFVSVRELLGDLVEQDKGGAE